MAGQTPVVSLEGAALFGVVKNGRKRVGRSPQTCDSRGCNSPGEYSLRRVTRGGKVHSGMYCDKHEASYGLDNLKKCAEEVGGKVVIMIDAEGQFEGILTD